MTITASEREEFCESFAMVTPGMYELEAAMETLSDPGANDQVDAMKVAMNGGDRSHAYDCDLPSDEDLFTEYVERQVARQNGETE
ncbi:hypothetical protein BO226_25655 (plasmid) [Rhodococcus sp. 2G]|uniref:hypothetical protein n=1 Tax=unclassified Rhodococcus (in: high G+C Gram-positive bacteria) TaxID=192944 RepID=UPI0007DA2637|nr:MULTISPECIES: hypothetical protein [unclassified Rhodococcus (in: high G+C Gram-positive bacteria)]APE12731.1 hypothetical protein BO226_25655 [Rhodococcus sp. 2G]